MLVSVAEFFSRVPKSQWEAKQMLGAEWRNEWGQYGPQVFRDEVCRVLVKRAVASLSKYNQVLMIVKKKKLYSSHLPEKDRNSIDFSVTRKIQRLTSAFFSPTPFHWTVTASWEYFQFSTG